MAGGTALLVAAVEEAGEHPAARHPAPGVVQAQLPGERGHEEEMEERVGETDVSSAVGPVGPPESVAGGGLQEDLEPLHAHRPEGVIREVQLHQPGGSLVNNCG